MKPVHVVYIAAKFRYTALLNSVLRGSVERSVGVKTGISTCMLLVSDDSMVFVLISNSPVGL
jgi:hypothetical protein